MSKEISKYTNKTITLLPFGVNTDLFKPQKVKSLFPEGSFVMGTVKNLKPVYGIDILIEVFNLIKIKWPDFPVKLLIVGGGSQEAELKSLIEKYNLSDDTIFTGEVKNKNTPLYYNMMHMAAFLSHRESFGVAALEASACGIPVIVSKAPGFYESVVDGKSGLIIDTIHLEYVADVIKNLLIDERLQKEMGLFGRHWVQDNFEENKIVDNMINYYETCK